MLIPIIKFQFCPWIARPGEASSLDRLLDFAFPFLIDKSRVFAKIEDRVISGSVHSVLPGRTQRGLHLRRYAGPAGSILPDLFILVVNNYTLFSLFYNLD